jgi:hypothetical protein
MQMIVEAYLVDDEKRTVSMLSDTQTWALQRGTMRRVTRDSRGLFPPKPDRCEAWNFACYSSSPGIYWWEKPCHFLS